LSTQKKVKKRQQLSRELANLSRRIDAIDDKIYTLQNTRERIVKRIGKIIAELEKL
jgi:chorismate mutase